MHAQCWLATHGTEAKILSLMLCVRFPVFATGTVFGSQTTLITRQYSAQVSSKKDWTRRAVVSREQWHLRQKSAGDKPKDGLSKNKQFKQIPLDPNVMKKIEELGVGKRRKERGKYAKTTTKTSIYKAAPPQQQQSTLLRKPQETTEEVQEKVEEEVPLTSLKYWASAGDSNSFIPAGLPETAFIGRSNVGKSSLINALNGGHELARVSDVAGKTRTVNWYNFSGNMFLVDLPGLGFAFASDEQKAHWKDLIYSYLSSRRSLERVFILVDSRHGFKAADTELITFLESQKVHYTIIMTKTDLVLAKDLARRFHLIKAELKEKHFATKTPVMVSSLEKKGITELRSMLSSIVLQHRKKTGVAAEKRTLESQMRPWSTRDTEEDFDQGERKKPQREGRRERELKKEREKGGRYGNFMGAERRSVGGGGEKRGRERGNPGFRRSKDEPQAPRKETNWTPEGQKEKSFTPYSREDGPRTHTYGEGETRQLTGRRGRGLRKPEERKIGQEIRPQKTPKLAVKKAVQHKKGKGSKRR
eukprot:TRINITY_DN11490_c0_g1_i1.p1 TRINITY_DN11490_c0_g1~~TRINITY_DN11490_c0_g1_i1.p1  ORF type:complete len:531 (+),score=153.49 TRINITY_DN11490_c0_g1_i1:58-1650(+)